MTWFHSLTVAWQEPFKTYNAFIVCMQSAPNQTVVNVLFYGKMEDVYSDMSLKPLLTLEKQSRTGSQVWLNSNNVFILL